MLSLLKNFFFFVRFSFNIWAILYQDKGVTLIKPISNIFICWVEKLIDTYNFLNMYRFWKLIKAYRNVISSFMVYRTDGRPAPFNALRKYYFIIKVFRSNSYVERAHWTAFNTCIVVTGSPILI